MDRLQHAVSLHQQGLLDAAHDAYLAILKRTPRDINALNFMGVLCFQRGNPQEGGKFLRKCLQIKPDFAQAHNNLGNGYMQTGNLKEAMLCFSRAVSLAPDYADAHHNLANAYGKRKEFERAYNHALKAVTHAPGFAMAWVTLATTLYGLNRKHEALDAATNALNIYPGLPEGALIRARVLWSLGRYLDAVPDYRASIEKFGRDPDVLSEFGGRLLEVGRWDEALPILDRLVQVAPDNVAGLLLQGRAYEGLWRYGEAESVFRQAAALAPESSEPFWQLSKVLQTQKKYQEAEVAIARALEINPESIDLLLHLSTLLSSTGRMDDALSMLEALLARDPGNAEVLSMTIFLSNYSVRYSAEQRFQLALKYGQLVSGKAEARIERWSVDPSPVRLKIGLVSGDILEHPVGLFLESLITKSDRTRIEFVAYPSHRTIDDLSLRLIPFLSGWKPISGMSDKMAAEMIRADGVHILLDLSGHTGHICLPVFAWKPAPVQVSWLGYFATTGVREIDYFVADEAGAPLSLQQFFCERIWRLPETRMCFSPPRANIEVAPLPALGNGYVTFGSFQNIKKLQPSVLKAWVRVLEKVGSARFRLQSPAFADVSLMEAFRLRFEELGGDGNRLLLVGPVAREEYLATYGQVDIVLDTFPFTGGTTTCEALWMGVPTLTLAGDNLIARQGVSMMTAAGLPDWVADDEDEYVEKAMMFSENIEALAQLRQGLREQVLRSALFDAERFAQDFEDAMFSMWNEAGLAAIHACG